MKNEQEKNRKVVFKVSPVVNKSWVTSNYILFDIIYIDYFKLVFEFGCFIPGILLGLYI